MKASAKSWLPVAACVAVSVTSLWLRLRTPMSARGEAMHDDALFVRLAYNLLQHQWLGAYDNLILAKGMFFPLFIAAMSSIGLPLRLGEHIVYLAAAAVACRFVARHGGRGWLGAVLFAVLAFNPLLWGFDFELVLRDGLYVGLALAVGSLYAALVFSSGGWWRSLALSMVLGLALGAFWLTREEGIWILPCLATLAVFAAGRILLRRAPGWRGRMGRLALGTAIAALIAVGCNGIVATINQQEYGVFETVEFKSRNFVRGYSALASIAPSLSKPKIVATAAQRQLAYSVSPAARELQPYLDGQMGENWKLMSCGQDGVAADQCSDTLAGWFMWELRDAVTAAGHGGSAVDADAFYGRMADEIEQACAAGRIECLIRHPTLAPPFRWQDVRASTKPGLRLLRMAFRLDPRAIFMLPNSGSPEQLAPFLAVFGPREMAASTPEHAAKFDRIPSHHIAEACLRIYGWVVPVLSIVALFGLLGAPFFRQRVPLPLYALSFASLVAVMCRIVLLAYLAATSIPAGNELYLSACTPFVLVFAVTGTFLASQIYRPRSS